LTKAAGLGLAAGMANVLSGEKRQQVIVLGRLGWSLRRIKEATGVRRETASAYLKAAGIAVRPPGRCGRAPKPANEVSTDSGAVAPATPANAAEVSTDSEAGPPAGPAIVGPDHSPRTSRCEPYRAVIVAAVGRGRNAMVIWQDLVDRHGFAAGYASVRRFVRALRGVAVPEARAIIQTPPGEQGEVDYGEGRWSAIRSRGSTAARASSSSRLATAGSACGSSRGGPATASGRNSTNAPFAASAVPRP
jgi:hypothetical protein